MKRQPFPAVPMEASPQMRAFLNAIRDYVEVMAGGLADSRRRSVSFDDLVDMGVITHAEAAEQSKVKT